ncbi:MAG: dATP pyrophosphohydrolase [Rhizobiales bacterium]|nr:dATP pyrophosphohydrolase [Hyphomicrobiales bacterium]
MSEVFVKEVRDKKGTLDFLHVPFPLYKNDPNWVAPLFFERLEHLSPKKNPYFQHADVQLFVAYRDGKPVGRISAQHDRLRLEHHKDNTGQFGFFESENDPAVSRPLFAAATNWLTARGLTRVRGPYNFSINDEIGMLVHGFEHKPNMMMGHALPYYQDLMDDLGLHKVKDLIAYYTEDLGPMPPLLSRVTKRAMATGDIKVRPLDKKHIKRDINIVMDIFNDAWSHNWDYVPFTAAELEKLANDLKMLVHGEYVAIVTYKGENAAMSVTLPNLNDWIDGFNGKLLPFNWLKLAKAVATKRPHSIRMPLLGVRKKFQDGLLGSALAVAAIDTTRNYHISRGVRAAEMSWILEDNMRIRHIIEELGAQPYKTYRVYEKDL